MKAPSIPVRIGVAAALLVAALVGVVVREHLARDAGREVRLRIDGYDPRELLTGHYVEFQIQETRNGACPPGGQQPAGRAGQTTSWVALRTEGAREVPVGAYSDRTAAHAAGSVVVRGRLTCWLTFTPLADGAESAENALRVQLDVGVNRIHLEQAQAEAMAKVLNQPGSTRDAMAVLSVDDAGKARLKGVIVAGRRADLSLF